MVAQQSGEFAELLSLARGSSRPGPGRGENGAGTPRRPGGAAAGVSLQTAFPAPFPRPGRSSPAAGRPGRALPGAVLLPHSAAGLQSQEVTDAEPEGAVEPAASRRRQPVSRVAKRGDQRTGSFPFKGDGREAGLVGGRCRELEF